MRLTSTRDKTVNSSFANAIQNCMPSDGGLYVPDGTADLRRWILYTNENTSFASIAGALTSAFINNEYSPIICETIATKAFPFEPVLKQLDEKLFVLELFHGPTCCYRDFGVSYLINMLETTLHMENKNSILLDYTSGEHGSILAKSLEGKKHIKSVLLYPKGQVCGISEKDFIWNGGNIYPIEIDGDAELGHRLINEVFKDKDLVGKLNLTVSTSANIGRLIPQTFFFTYAFSRLKNKVSSDIYYALDPENYGNLVAGLYSWRLSLPVSGFILPSTKELTLDAIGNPVITDSIIPVEMRIEAEAGDPSNMERFEDFFSHYAAMMKNFVYLSDISEEETEQAEKDLFIKYKRYSDYHTAKAYAAAVKNQDLIDEEGGAIVLLDRFHPAFSASYINQTIGDKIKIPEAIINLKKPVSIGRPVIKTPDELTALISALL
ncbi:MAG: threonine synthase [Treponema sp.]|uniref:threonine synthase n=1 Tax=Treponema sp. TaxID=166 RepID=UPI00298E6A7A|nr:threonine synthase [Treponema sp.]MBR5933706.1 threonine synthase [Treponema sp.]